MPELPEVTTIVNQLQKEIVGATITDVWSIEAYRTQPEIGEFKGKVIGQEVIGVSRIAKTIAIELGDSSEVLGSGHKSIAYDLKPSYLVIHLAMTGRLLLRSIGSKPDPWTRLVLQLTIDNSPRFPSRLQDEADAGEAGSQLTKRELRFCDSRMFGFVKLMTADELEAHKKRYGPDALDPKFDHLQFLRQLRGRRTGVKRALLEQELIAGIGNIYANDALWLSQIHPETPTENITANQALNLLEAVRNILEESIKQRGSTLDDKMYVDLYGQEGEHQNHFRVYGKAGQPCPRCQLKIEFKEIGGRGTFYCLACQVKSEVKYNLSTIDPQQTKLL